MKGDNFNTHFLLESTFRKGSRHYTLKLSLTKYNGTVCINIFHLLRSFLIHPDYFKFY